MKNIKKISKTITDLPSPSSIRFLWNFGFILGILLSVQIITGVILSINYIQSELEAFPSIIHIIRDTNNGWINRLIHSNTASLFFIRLLTHIGRGIFYGSFKTKSLTWLRGSTIFLISMATAFFGYVLPWGQMSYWGATVITNIVSALPYVGKDLVEWLWGNFSISQPTLNRFFSIHYLLPVILSITTVHHIFTLHKTGRSNPTGNIESLEKVEFHPIFTNKDTIFLIAVSIALLSIITNLPNYFIDPENINEANPIKAPVHIQPEWYFLFAYAILRSIPSKLGGIVAIVSSIVIIFFVSIKKADINRRKFSPKRKIKTLAILFSFVTLTFIGRKPVEEPYISTGKFLSTSYFLSILI